MSVARIIPAHAWELGFDWKAALLLGAVHALGVVGGDWRLFAFFDARTVCLAVALFFLCHLSVRLGAHSLYTHRAYEASLLWHAWNLVCFTATLQGPIRVWVLNHTRHHKYTDTVKDPYSPAHGFLWAHVLWTCFKLPKDFHPREAMWMFAAGSKAQKRVLKMIQWQGKYALPGGFVLGVVLPGVIALLWDDFWGGIFIAGFLRLVFQYHCTWQINSVSHIVGPQPHGSQNSSRNSPWWMFGVPSLLSVGEASQHNRHHALPGDFRIGVGYFALDVGKWVLYGAWGVSRLLRAVGLPSIVWNLRRLSEQGPLQLLE